ncbi:MAG TPA: SbmA/BacA-like family transporter [Polyangiaceae bacterium]|jgi:putative ATP-binding cassette transporter|nr:SbmA/BacA-like family transporter [Polyangiaceae bacterium]
MAASSPGFDTASMAAAPLDVGIASRLWLELRRLLTSEIRGKVRLMFAGIVALLLGINGLNVVNSYVTRDLMTAIEQRSMPSFIEMIGAMVVVFAGLILAAVIVRFMEERLALLWRDWLTRLFVSRYLEGGAYLRLKERGEAGNPDQRITDDVRAFTATTLSFVLMGMNAAFGIIAFSGVLWSINPALFFAALAYSLLGTLMTVAVGHRLVRLNYHQSDCEASFRAELVHAGENAESVALLQFEGRLRARLSRRIDALVLNMKRIVAMNRRIGVLATGYNYGVQLLPPLIVGPLFIHGRVEFGVVTQSAIGFANLLSSFSLIVTQFGSISSYAATVVRLGGFSSALERPTGAPDQAPTGTGKKRLAYEDLTLFSRSSEECLVANLSVEIEVGTRLLITGTDEARRELFRATALGREVSGGRVLVPAGRCVLFLPERPYVPPATLRELIVQSGNEHAVSDDAIETVLRDLGLESALARVGGLDAEGDFGHALSLGEQQLLAVARVVLAAPAFVVLHNPDSTLAPEQLELALARFGEAGITYLTLGVSDSPFGLYDSVLEIHAGGSWGFRRVSQLPSRPNSGPLASAPRH